MSRPLSLLPRLSARPTVPAPPASYEAALAAAQARLDSRQVGAPVAWACVLWGVRHG